MKTKSKKREEFEKNLKVDTKKTPTQKIFEKLNIKENENKTRELTAEEKKSIKILSEKVSQNRAAQRRDWERKDTYISEVYRQIDEQKAAKENER